MVASAMPEAGGVKVAQADDRGKKVYDTACTTCHATGVAGAPKLGDKALWAPRIAQGMDTLYTHSIKGFQGKVGVMPPKGGFVNLSDAEVKAAVDYMVAKAK
jgi:cytochrome c5